MAKSAAKKGAGKSKPAQKRNPNTLYIDRERGEDVAAALARTAIRPTVQAALTLKDYAPAGGEIELTSLIKSLSEQTNAAIDGNLHRAKAMLAVQAHALNAIFNNLSRRAINTEYMDNLERYLKLALRAQS